MAFLLTGASEGLAETCRAWTGNFWGQTALFGAVLVVATKILFLPLNWLTDFYLEHRFGLSNETLAGWAGDELKSLALNLALGVPVLLVVYLCLRMAGAGWWWWATGAVVVLGAGLSALFPVAILPLFYKLQPLDNEALRQKLVTLADRVGAKVLGVYRIELSEKTKKANAAFAGVGATKRILLGDTLLNEFADDEIEVVMAHEMAHYRHGDIGKMIAWSAATTGAGFWVCDWGLRLGLERLGFADRSDLGAFPLLALCLFGFGLVVTPLHNAFSRWRERLADRTALDLTGNPAAFIRAMNKLAAQNLADVAPHPVIEFLLHSHPSLQSRINFAKQWSPN